jgi:L-aspartate oxidase
MVRRLAPDAADVPADVVVVGSGVAGLTAALDAAALGLRVLVLTRSRVGAGSTGWAQGGLAAVMVSHPVPGDGLELHVRDTLVAGAGLNDPEAVRSILGEAGAAVEDLVRRGAVFDSGPDGDWQRTREGGHSASRVIHAGGDATGAEVSRALVSHSRRSGLVVLEGHRAIGLRMDHSLTGSGNTRRRVAGVMAIDPDGHRIILPAHAVILATGGVGHLFDRTTNPPEATGDGLALALRAGAAVADAEFVQFHPTALATDPTQDGQLPLVTEAIRGEGGILRDAAGLPLMAGVHPDVDLAPRDVVALTMARYLERTGEPHVWLDATAIPEVTDRFPTVARSCQQIGVDLATDYVPVLPAAHYHCGGVATDLNGWTGVDGLYAVGEVARTGLHGANRLASNSLVEGLVTGRRCARMIARGRDGHAPDDHIVRVASDPGRSGAVSPPGPESEPGGDEDIAGRIRATMSARVGIARSAGGLSRAADVLAGLVGGQEQDELMRLSASVIVASALARDESRGCHQRLDHPEAGTSWQHSARWCLSDPDSGDDLKLCLRSAQVAETPVNVGDLR